MSTLLGKNLNILESYHRDVFDLMERLSREDTVGLGLPDTEFGAETIEDRDVLYGIKEGRLFQLDSMYSSDGLLDIWEAHLDPLYGAKFLMFGLGNGMYARRILKMLSPGAFLLVYEPDCRLFHFVLEHFDLTDILKDERMILMFPQTEEKEFAEGDLFHVLGASLEYTDIDALKRLTYMSYERLYPEEHAYFETTVTEVISSMVANRDVMRRFGESFVKNSLGNAPVLERSLAISSLHIDDPEKVPGIIVSSGPSLGKNIEELKRAKGRAFIACADSAVSVLLKADIVPDMFFCVDAKKNKGHFEDPRVADIPLCCDIDTTRNAFVSRRAPEFFGKGRNPHISAFEEARGMELPKLKTGGSVAHAAMSFMLQIGIRRIILVGQDLAYTDNKSHAEGSLRASWQLDLSKNECYMEGIDGTQVRSSHEFMTYRNWFERAITMRPDAEVINATEGGARIHGAKEMTLREAVDEYCTSDFDASAFLLGAKPLMSDEQRAEFEAYMGDLKTEIEKLSTEIRSGLRIYDEMYKMVWDGKYNNPRFKKLYDKVCDVSAMLEESSAMYYVDCMVQKEMTELMDRPPATGDDRAQLIDTLERGRDYFATVNKGIDKVEEILK